MQRPLHDKVRWKKKKEGFLANRSDRHRTVQHMHTQLLWQISHLNNLLVYASVMSEVTAQVLQD